MRNLISGKICFVVCYKKKNNKQIKTKQKRESKYLEVTGDVIVESLTRLLVRQARWLTKLAKNGGLTERAITTT